MTRSYGCDEPIVDHDQVYCAADWRLLEDDRDAAIARAALGGQP